MNKGVLDVPVLVALGFFNTGVSANRIDRIYAYLCKHWGLPTKRYLLTPEHTHLLKIWEDYLISDKESLGSYDELTKAIKNIFGYDCYADTLNYTNYLLRSGYMNKKGMRDVESEKLLCL